MARAQGPHGAGSNKRNTGYIQALSLITGSTVGKCKTQRVREERKEIIREERGEDRTGEKRQIGFPEQSSFMHIFARVHPSMEINLCVFVRSEERGKFSSLKEPEPENF